MSTTTIEKEPPGPIDLHLRRREVFSRIYQLFVPRPRDRQAPSTTWVVPSHAHCDLDSPY